MTHQPTVELQALVLRLAHAAGHNPGDPLMPWREELALAAAALAGFHDAARLGLVTLETVGLAMGLVDDLSEHGLSVQVRLLEALQPGSYAKLLEPAPLFSCQQLVFNQAS